MGSPSRGWFYPPAKPTSYDVVPALVAVDVDKVSLTLQNLKDGQKETVEFELASLTLQTFLNADAPPPLKRKPGESTTKATPKKPRQETTAGHISFAAPVSVPNQSPNSVVAPCTHCARPAATVMTADGAHAFCNAHCHGLFVGSIAEFGSL